MSSVKLYYGSNINKINELIIENINSSSFDVLIVKKDEDKNSIGIDKVREVIEFLNQKPFELKNKFVIIPSANLLTIQAQNALLKTLEEPPFYADIRLSTKVLNDLQKTLTSRCIKIHIKESGVGESEKKFDLNDFKSIKKGDRIDYVNQISDFEKTEILQILELWIEQERESIIKKSKSDKKIIIDIKFIETLLKVYEDIKFTNMNSKFLLEYLCLSFD